MRVNTRQMGWLPIVAAILPAVMPKNEPDRVPGWATAQPLNPAWLALLGIGGLAVMGGITYAVLRRPTR